MRFSWFSLRSITALLMVLLSMVVVVVSWDTYRQLAYENQRQDLSESLYREALNTVESLTEVSRDMALNAQYSVIFREAFIRGDSAIIQEAIDDQFRQYLITADLLKLVQFYVYDRNFRLLSQASKGPQIKEANQAICVSLVEQGHVRSGSERLKIISELCRSGGKPYLAVMVPIGGLRPIGYLQIIVDPIHSLKMIEEELRMPVQIRLPKGELVYQSDNWGVHTEENTLIGNYLLMTTDRQPALEFDVAQDISEFRATLNESRNRVMAAAGTATLVIVMFTILILEKTTLKPLQRLTEQLHRVGQNRKRLSETVTIEGNAEVRALASMFNEMGSELSRLYDRYEEMAYIDPLTGLPNRRFFQDCLLKTLSQSAQKKQKFTILLLDLDGFKEINDTLGHHVGDLFLGYVGKLLHGSLRALGTISFDQLNATPGVLENELGINGAMIARLGGDEFAILLPIIKESDDAVAVARCITQVLEPAVEIEGQSIVVSGSIGIATFPEHGIDAETLMRRADIALYAAKKTKTDYAIYDPVYDQNSSEQLTLNAELRAAIHEGQLLLHYQPKLDLVAGHVNSVEALVRWQHPERGLIFPDQFINIAEQRGLIGALTEWVLREALMQHKLWYKQGINLSVAVNVSPRVLYDLHFPEKIQQILNEFELSSEVLQLEITEEATMVDPERALKILHRLDEMGILLAIDDFGTGYSSLGYLKRLPVDEIKIDKTFVMEIAESEDDTKIVHATIDLAHNLNLKVVAEGVENESTLKTLQALGCDYAQGFFISHPAPAPQFIEWLMQTKYKPKH